MNNYGIFDEFEFNLRKKGFGRMALVHFQVAGALRLEVQYLIVEECYFFNNSNLKGGAIYLNKNQNYEAQYIYISKTIFRSNEAGDNGGCIELEKNIQKIIGNISNCYFLENFAWRKKNIYKNLFY